MVATIEHAAIERVKAGDWQYFVVRLSAKPAEGAFGGATPGSRGVLLKSACWFGLEAGRPCKGR
jgi:hypothetical protein